MRVGIYANSPKVYFNEQGRADGILVDMLRAVAESEDWKLNFVSCEWEQCLRLVQEGGIDLLPDVAWSAERSLAFDFHTVPALHSWSQVYRHPEVAIVSMLDLSGKRIAILNGSIQEGFFPELAKDFGVTPMLLPVTSLDEGFALVEQRRADAIVTNKHAGNSHAASEGLAETPIMFQPTRLFYVSGKGRHPDVLAAIDRRLSAWQQDPDSPYFSILEQWENKDALGRVPQWVLWASATVVGMLMLTLLQSYLLRRQVERKTGALRDSEQRLSTILDSVESLIYIKDTAYRYAYVNRAVREFFNRSDADIIGKDDTELFGAPVAAVIHANDVRTIEHRERVVTEEDVPDAAGQLITVLTTKIPLCRDDGSVYGLCGISLDISERRAAEESNRVAATVFQSEEGMFIAGPDQLVLKVNDAYTSMTGYTADELSGRDAPWFSLHRDGADAREAVWEAAEHLGKWQGEIWTRRKNGDQYPAWLTVTAVRDSLGKITNYVATQADITQQKMAQDRIMQLAYYDPLTGLPNRRLLLERLQHCLPLHNRSKQSVALLFLDLDNFKDLNDTRGHETGDQLLKQVGQRIASCTREGDTVARLGGDEFVILLENIGTDEQEATGHAAAIGWKIIRAVGAPYVIGDTAHHTTCSIGAALRTSADTEIDDLMKRGDLAMYEAKKDGRNTLRFFHESMESDVTYRLALETELRDSLGKSEFMLHFQPQVNGSGHITGAEALLRWNHVKRGIVGPAVFVPIAESSGLIVQLGNWGMRTACVELARWGRTPGMEHLTLAVNVSVRQIRQANFVEETLAVVKETGANPHRLKLELTETVLIESVEDTIAKMHQLKEQGIGFSLDDFGTGYSSLSYLKRLPLDQLKIDRSFVRDVLVDPNDASIARSIVALAKALGLGIIAEGVETEAQHGFLAEIGCSCYQGYLFGRPMDADMLEHMIRTGVR